MRYFLIGLLCLLLVKFALATKCQFCNKDFISLNRHIWRCQSRITDTASAKQASTAPSFPTCSNDDNTGRSTLNQASIPPLASDLETCVCGKRCKGRRGLAAHQRSCRAYKDLIDCAHLDHASRHGARRGSRPFERDRDGEARLDAKADGDHFISSLTSLNDIASSVKAP